MSVPLLVIALYEELLNGCV